MTPGVTPHLNRLILWVPVWEPETQPQTASDRACLTLADCLIETYGLTSVLFSVLSGPLLHADC